MFAIADVVVVKAGVVVAIAGVVIFISSETNKDK